MSRRVWVVSSIDGEALKIQRLLAAAGEYCLKSDQAWGAIWRDLEPSIQSQLAQLRAQSPPIAIYGVELAGPNPYGARNIEHHRYGDEEGEAARKCTEGGGWRTAYRRC